MECRPINPPEEHLSCEECDEIDKHDNFEMVYKDGDPYGWFLCPDCADKKKQQLKNEQDA
jgi:uncharacterized protein YlaI